MDAIIRHASSLNGTLSLPADKAICHRAALLCALADGPTEIAPWSSAEDCQKTLAIIQQLGVPVSRTGKGIRIEGVGLNGLRHSPADLDCGDSGTTMRLVCGVLAGQPFESESRLIAGVSLSHRPMRRILTPLIQMGANLKASSVASFEGYPPEDYPPLEIKGRRPLKAIPYTMPVASAQVKSAILLAGLYADGPTTVTEPFATRDHTERLLSRLGAGIQRRASNVTLQPPTRGLSSPERLAIPSDPSSAAFFIVAAAILPGSKLVIHDIGLNPTRSHFLNVLQRMGAAIRIEARDDGWEPRGTITVEYSPLLHGTIIEVDEVPRLIDELPILMVAACAAKGETKFQQLGELRVKESDRIDAMTKGLKLLEARMLPGADWENPDLKIDGCPLRAGTSSAPVEVESFGDHRIAMSLAVAGLLAEGETRIRHAECVTKSLGNFFELLASLVGPSHVQLVPETCH